MHRKINGLIDGGIDGWMDIGIGIGISLFGGRSAPQTLYLGNFVQIH